jgi:hypothetical protein
MEFTNPQTGERKTFYGTGVTQAIQEGWVAADATATVNVQLPGGQAEMQTDLAAKELDARPEGRASVVAPVSPDQKDAYEEQEYGGIGGAATAFVEGAADSLTLGLYSGAANLIGGDDYTYRQEKRAARNPGASTAGLVAGMVPTFFAGGAGAAGKLARLTPGGKLAAGSNKIEKALGGIRGTAAAMALEGAAYGAGQGVSDIVISDAPLTAEAVFSEVGLDAIVGAGLGAGVGIAAKGAGKLAAKRQARIAEAEAEITARLAKPIAKAEWAAGNVARGEAKIAKFAGKVDELEQEAARAALSVPGTVKNGEKLVQYARELDSFADDAMPGFDVDWELLAGRRKQIGSILDDAYNLAAVTGTGKAEAKLAIAARRKADDLLAKRDSAAIEALTEAETRINDLAEKVGSFAVPPLRTDYLVGRVVDETVGQARAAYRAALPKGLTPDGIADLASKPLVDSIRAGQALDDYVKALGPKAPVNHAWEALKPSKATDYAKMMGELGEGVTVTPSGQKLAALWMEQRATGAKFVEGAAKRQEKLFVAKQRLDEATSGQAVRVADKADKEANVVAARKALESEFGKKGADGKVGDPWMRRLVKQGASGVGGAAGYKAGGGGIPGAAMGAMGWSLGGMLGGSLFDFVVANAGLAAASSRGMRGRILFATEKLLKGTAKAGRRVTPLAILNESPMGDEGDGRDLQDAFNRRKSELLALAGNAQGSAERAYANLLPVRLAHQETGALVHANTDAALSFLHDRLPKDPGTMVRGGKSIYRHSETEMAKFARYVEAVHGGPANILEDFAEGNGSPEAAEVFRELFPEAARAFYSDLMQLMPLVEVPADRRFQLSLLLDVPLDTIFRPDRATAFQDTWKAAQESAAPAGSQPPPTPQPFDPSQMLPGQMLATQ